ncbi:ATP-binding protein [Roseateles koreensis]|uniref:AAA family ATPase n=1 Tax=Roseateles koreensis TaxID=2987526 RepID=A0ABT5KTP9_9BURK|nr:ATP-binding protein [Roseateles koreensis]MDC8786304.1 AAA family ATPase [Roseateles koreensis]
MRVLDIETGRGHLTFPDGKQWHSNQVDLLTGENGTGKTEILESLAQFFRPSASHPKKEVQISWLGSGHLFSQRSGEAYKDGPARTIAQTFSPFSRFPAPIVGRTSLAQNYGESKRRQSNYVCVGLHRGSRSVGHETSSRILEDALIRLSESTKSTGSILRVLHELKFHPRIDLEYERHPLLNKLFEELQRHDTVLPYLQQNSEELRIDRTLRGFTRELNEKNIEPFSDLLNEALRQAIGLKGNSNQNIELRLEIDSISREYAVFQAISVLRQLNLVDLEAFHLHPFDMPRLDISEASSGQQQMLCSIIGLASSLDNNSLVLIDEPELSLHPKWQAEYIDHLAAALSPFEECHVIVATHSPLIVQRAQELHANINQLKQLSDGSAQPTVSIVEKSVAGEPEAISVEQTLIDVFATPLEGSTHVANEIFNSIVDAECGTPVERAAAMIRLHELQSLYSEYKQDNGKTLASIRQALRAVETTDLPNGRAGGAS